jgi:hypothetical protein
MNAAFDFRLYGPAIGPARPPSQPRLGSWIDWARHATQWLRTRRLIGVARAARPRTVIFADVERLDWNERRRAAAL